ncbi:MAG: hypothetical protein CM1200mP3_16320 [Chloroflexota bacterium]|nr:MAG: hypothetical protein CM1200mP3_16320 [Chloroflexota bacterium]
MKHFNATIELTLKWARMTMDGNRKGDYVNYWKCYPGFKCRTFNGKQRPEEAYIDVETPFNYKGDISKNYN